MKTNKVRKNIKKSLLNGLLYTLMVLIFLLPSLAFLFHDPIVQTLTGRFVTHWLTSKVGNVISVDGVQIGLRSGLTLKGVLVKDNRDSTMIKVDELIAKPIYADWGLFGLRFSKVELDGAEVRLAQYTEDDNINLVVMLDKFIDRDAMVSSPKAGHHAFVLKMRKLILKNSLFQYYNEQMDLNIDSKMNYSNIVFDSINLDAAEFVIVDDSLNFKVKSLSTRERSGIKISGMNTDFSISRSGLKANNLLMEANHSRLDLDFGFNYNSYQSYRYFIDSVRIMANIRPSTLFLSDLGFYTPVLEDLPSEVGITGNLYGVISDFSAENIRVHYADNTRIALDGEIRGLPDFFSSEIIADVQELNTTRCELYSLNLPIEGKHLDLSDYFKCNDRIRMSGKFRGRYNDFKTDFKLNTGEGSLKADVDFADIPGDTVHFAVTARGDSVHLGKLLDQQPLLGNINFDINAKGRGKDWENIRISSGGTLKSTDFMGYNYSRIRYSGKYRKNHAEGNLVVGDQNLMMNADVKADLVHDPELDIIADIKHANLERLKIWQGYNFSFSANVIAKISGLDPDSMTGRLLMNNSVLTFGNDDYKLNNLILDKKLDDKGISTIDLQSDYADLNLSGKYNIISFPDRFIDLIDHYLYAIPLNDSIKSNSPEYASLNFTLHNDDLIKDHLVPGLSISPNTTLNANIDFDKYQLEINSNFEEMVIDAITMKNNILNVSTKNGWLAIEYTNEHTIFRDSTETEKTVFGIDHFGLATVARNDSLAYDIHWNNDDSIYINKGNFNGYYRHADTANYFRILNSEVYINDTLWRIDPKNKLIIDTTGITFQDAHIFGGLSSMNLNGKFPRKDGDSLIVTFDKWNLSNFDMLTKIWNFDLDGIVNGSLQYSLVNDIPVFVSNIVTDHLALNKEYLGTAELFNTWNNKDQSISLESKVFREGNAGRGEIISVNGRYYPFNHDDKSLDLNISFNRLNINALEPFFVDFISQLEGVAAGDLKLTGSFGNPVLTGFVDMHRAQLLINYLNTKYSFSNVINFEKDRINFDDLVIYDTLGNFATVDGSLKHDHFRNTQFDVDISTDKLLAFNTTSKMNELYYGTGITSGKLKISGSTKNMNLDMNISTQAGTDVKLPLDYSVEISDKDYIIFRNHTDSVMLKDVSPVNSKQTEKEGLEYDINMGITINPKAKVTIYLPSDMGKIESEGKGNLTMNTNTDGDFTLVGDYVVEKGLFHFSLANLINKRFDLVKGGRISWTGDPYRANVSIKGLYRVKTNISSLGISIDSTASYRNKVTVECYVILKNQLLNPDIKFEIMMPDLDPDLQRMVYAQLDTTNQAMMNQQMISLLALGTFSYSNANNITLSSAYYNVVANQLSSMLSRISDDFDIGVNYKPGDNVSQEEFEVALSTQLFDDRLMIDGHFGMTYDRSGQNASNIVGDVDIGYKLTEDGRWILKAYNHSNVNSWYNYSNYEKISPYTQGVGIAYRKEFTNISELFKRSKSKQNKKDEKRNAKATKEEE